MNQSIKFIVYISLPCILLFTSCSKSPLKTLNGPVANAGNDQVFASQPDSVKLDGKASSDPDGRIVSYQWTRLDGPGIGIINASTSDAIIVNRVPGLLQGGVYDLELKVTDDHGRFARDIVEIIIKAPPETNAGVDQIILLPENSCTLLGRGSTDIISSLWSQVTGPSTANIQSPALFSTTVSGLVQGTYQFSVKATNQYGYSNSDTMSVSVKPDTLTGHEYVFDNLLWQVDDDIFVYSPDRPDLFFYPSRHMDVFIKPANSLTWISVPEYDSSYPNNTEYLYYLSGAKLVINPTSNNLQLVGTRASMKVKFL